MFQFTKDVKLKDWKMFEVAARWGVTPTRMSQIARNPKQMHLDALNGLPDRLIPETMEE